MGLDPKENRQERERKKAEENKPPPLNPPFPFRVVAFDPWTYGAPERPAARSIIDTAPPTAQ